MIPILFYFFTILGILYFSFAVFEIIAAPKKSVFAVIIAETEDELSEKIKEKAWKPFQEQLKK